MVAYDIEEVRVRLEELVVPFGLKLSDSKNPPLICGAQLGTPGARLSEVLGPAHSHWLPTLQLAQPRHPETEMPMARGMFENFCVNDQLRQQTQGSAG